MRSEFRSYRPVEEAALVVLVLVVGAVGDPVAELVDLDADIVVILVL